MVHQQIYVNNWIIRSYQVQKEEVEDLDLLVFELYMTLFINFI